MDCNPFNELHAIWVACCIELHSLKAFKTFYTGQKETSKEWKALPKQIKQISLSTSEAMAFYFRFMANSHEDKIQADLRKGNRERLLQLALKSSNIEIKNFAKRVLILQKKPY